MDKYRRYKNYTSGKNNRLHYEDGLKSYSRINHTLANVFAIGVVIFLATLILITLNISIQDLYYDMVAWYKFFLTILPIL